MARIDAFIFLNVKRHTLEKRHYGRISYRRCGSVYDYYFMQPRMKGICDRSVDLLVERDDCGKETISNRLKEYYDKTEPIKGILDDNLLNVNGELSVMEVHRSIVEYLNDGGIS